MITSKKTTLSDIAKATGVAFGTSGARGLVAQMSDSVCYAYTAAFLKGVAGQAGAIVLGHDLRPSSPAISRACATAIRDAGLKVIYAGALPTPALAFYASVRRAPAVMVTGSHIPHDRNGIKFYRATGEITKADEAAMLSAELPVFTPEQVDQLPPVSGEASSAYLRRYTDFFGPGALAGSRVAVYEHSSVGRDALAEIFTALGAEVISLGRTDSFVPIDTEAVRAEDIALARKWAQEYSFDVIVSTDGDGDRPLIGDENGEWLRGDVVGILCAQYLAADSVVTPISSNTAVEKCGAFKTVTRTRIGSPYVIAGMESAQGEVVIGYEANGGFLLGSEVEREGRRLAALPTRDAVLPILAIMSMARARACRISELAAGLPSRFTASDRLQDFPTAAARELIARLGCDLDYAAVLLAPDAGPVAGTDTTDGLRITFGTGEIVHLRPSGNAPELRCYAEAGSQERAQQLCNESLRRIAGLRVPE